MKHSFTKLLFICITVVLMSNTASFAQFTKEWTGPTVNETVDPWYPWAISTPSNNNWDVQHSSFRYITLVGNQIQVLPAALGSTPEYTYDVPAAVWHEVLSLNFDFTGDGITEFLLRYIDSGTNENVIRIINLVSGAQIAEFRDASNYFDSDPIIADIDKDNQIEIVFKAHTPLNESFQEMYSTGLSVGVTESASSQIPETFKLSQNYPNPFNPITKIPFSLHKPGSVKLTIFNTQGSIIKNLVVGAQYGAGEHAIVWDGRNEFGVHVASGTYFYTMQIDGQEFISKKMVMIK
ncbi:FlgD immunoglobulin-like domain containing protein [candidate division KSB1 bacterium]